MRALAILYCYPPLLVPASMCYAKLMLGLRAAGVDVEILTIDPQTFASPGPTPLDRELEARMPSDIRNHVSRSPENSWWMQLIKRLDAQRRLSYRWLEPKKREWLPPAMRQLEREDLSRFDLVLSCGQPHANHLLGLELKRRTGMPWIAYFSDPWTDSPYANFATPRIFDHHRALEDEVLAQADLVLFTCEEMRQLLLAKHSVLSPERSGVLPHAFIRDWYGSDAAPDAGAGALRILHTGSFYGPRTPIPLIDSLRRLSGQQRLDGRLRFEFYGGVDPGHVRTIAEAGLEPIFAMSSFIPYLESLQRMRASDGLILIDAPLQDMSQSVFLPSKLIDYLGADRPILAVTPGEGATARVLRECGGLVCPIEEPEALDHALSQLLADGRFPSRPDAAAAAAYDHRQVGADLARIMDGCLRPETAGAGAVDSPQALH